VSGNYHYWLYVALLLLCGQTYVNNSDKEFVTTTIQSIGRVACSISEVTEVCLHGLTTLLSNRDGM